MEDSGIETVIPQPGDLGALINRFASASPIVLSAAFPFVPAELGFHHLASTYFCADILARTHRYLGRRTALVSATDVHSIQVSSNGRTRDDAEPLCTNFDRAYRAYFEDFGIIFDAYIRTDAESHAWLTATALSRLDEQGLLIWKDTSQLKCLECQAHPPQRLLKTQSSTARCPWCNSSQIETIRSPHLYLDLEAVRSRVAGIDIPQPAHRNWLNKVLAEPLDPWCLSRDNAIGLPIPGIDAQKSLYLWFESLVGYATLQQELGHEFASRDVAFQHVFGKNIIYHHGVIWPVIARCGLELENSITCHVRGFSTVASDWVSEYDDRQALRFYAALTVPDRGTDYRLTRNGFEEFENKIWKNKIQNFLRRLDLQAAKAATTPHHPPNTSFVREWVVAYSNCITRIAQSAELGNSQNIALTILEFQRTTGRLAHKHGLFWSDDPEAAAEAAVAARISRELIALVSPDIDRATETAPTLATTANSLKFVEPA